MPIPKVEVSRITKNVLMLRLCDDETKYFEGLWYIPEGVTYNAYIATLPEGAIVFDGWKHTYGELFIETLKQHVDLKDIKYVVVHHTEPDHSGSLKNLLSIVDAIVVGHPMVKDLLNSFYGLNTKFKAVSDNENITFSGYTLKFIHVPWLHWPDTIVSYLQEEKMLFSCDVFGSYGIPSKVFFDDMDEKEKNLFKWYSKKYFANIIGKYIDWVQKNLAKLQNQNLDIRIVATGHGPLYRDLKPILELYKFWSSKQFVKNKTTIVYTSMYRFVEKAVKIVEEEIKNIEAKYRIYGFTDTHRDAESDIIGDVLDSENIVLATSTYDADIFHLMKHIANLINAKIPENKKILILASYGWGSVAGKKLKELLSKFKVVDIIEFKGNQIDREQVKLALKKLFSN